MKNQRILISLVILSLLSACTGARTHTATLAALDATKPASRLPATPTPAPTPTSSPQPLARLDTANTAFMNGDFDTAQTEYQNAIEFSQDIEIQERARVKLGRIAYLEGDSNKALELFRQVTASSAGTDSVSEAHFFLAQIYDDLNRYEDAASEYSAYLTLESSPLASYIYELQGDDYTDAGLYSQARESYDKSLQQPGADSITLKLKLGQTAAALGEDQTALDLYQEVFNVSTSEYVRAQVDLLTGQIYLKQGNALSAYDRFQDAVNNYPRAYDSYSALVALVNDGVAVNELNRGMVDYYAGQYAIAADVLKNYITQNPNHDGTAHYFRALALTNINDYTGAITEWDALIQDHPNDRFWATAWDEKSYTQWFYLGKYDEAANTMLDFVAAAPTDNLAPALLFEAGRTYERNNRLDMAISTWDRLSDEYPNSDYSYMGIFFAGITHYRQNQYAEALVSFQRASVLATDPTEVAGANFWMGKTANAAGDDASAQSYWQNAIQQDPTGYYSERARDLVTGRNPYQACKVLDLAVDLKSEIPGADAWMVQTFSLPQDTDFADNSIILSDARIQRAQEFWRLGLYSNARNEVESYRTENQNDALIQYRLGRWLFDLGVYRESILAVRQVLTLAGMDDNSTLTAPIYFNHVRFYPYYKNLVIAAANRYDLDPLLIYSVIRQESMFEPFIVSSAGAEGLMQMMPDTAREASSQADWPPVFLEDDIFRPQVAISLGSYYLQQQIRLQDGDIYAGLAAYNGGLGNASAWRERSNGDPDLYLEVVRFKETRDYLRSVLEIFNLYKIFYCR